MSELLHPDAPTRTESLPWRVLAELEHTHCWHQLHTETDTLEDFYQCCRCDDTEVLR